MSAQEQSATLEGWFGVSEPAGPALGYVRPTPDAELGLMRQAHAIERVCSECELDLAGLLSDEDTPDAADSCTPALRHALEQIAAGQASALVVAELASLASSAAGIGTMMDWFTRAARASSRPTSASTRPPREGAWPPKRSAQPASSSAGSCRSARARDSRRRVRRAPARQAGGCRPARARRAHPRAAGARLDSAGDRRQSQR